MDKKQLIEIIEDISPSELAEPWDNCGFQIDCMPGSGADRILVSLEVTNDVIDEAVRCGADLILTHHPLIFGGVGRISEEDATGNYLIRLIRAGISVYSCHTSFDKAAGGNNDYFGELLELADIRPFDSGNPYCRRGETSFDITFAEMIHKTAQALNIEEKYFRTVGDLSLPVERVGWCTGAGSEFIEEARKEGCSLYITGDIKYHEAQQALESGICLLDAGHYGTEKIFTENMAGMLYDRLGGETEVLQSEVDINPFR